MKKSLIHIFGGFVVIVSMCFSSCSLLKRRFFQNSSSIDCRNSFNTDSTNRETSTEMQMSDVYLSVTTLNIGHFTNGASLEPNGTYEDVETYKKEFEKIDSDVITLNENSLFFDSDKTIASGYVYSSMPYYYCGSVLGYNCNAVLSKEEIQDPYEKVFDNSYSRYYVDVTISVCGITIHIITTHLDVDDVNVRQEQINEILNLLDSYDSFILCGDFNPNSRVEGVMIGDPLSQYPIVYSMFAGKGYKLANYGDFGTFNTLVKHEGQSIRPWDNIIVSPNFEIISVTRHDLILSDHYPFSAVIRIT